MWLGPRWGSSHSDLHVTPSTGIDLTHLIRKGKFCADSGSIMSFANQFYALARQIHPI